VGIPGSEPGSHIRTEDASDRSSRTVCADPDTELICRFEDDERTTAFAEVRGPDTVFFFVRFSGDSGPVPRTLTALVEISVESLVTACTNGQDDDGDGRVDLADPGCVDRRDADESDSPNAPVCGDGEDNDQDGASDWPADPDCTGAGDDDERRLCELVDDVIELGPEGGRVRLDTRGWPDLPYAECPRFGQSMVQRVIALTLDRAANVRVSFVEDNGAASLSLRSTCDAPPLQLACDDSLMRRSRPSITVPRLGPGTWFFFVGYNTTYWERDVVVEEGDQVELAVEVDPLPLP